MNDLKWVDFTQLDKETKIKVLNWRNDDKIRYNMFNSNYISQDQHLFFIESLKDNPTRKYYLVYKDSNPIGVVYMTNINYFEKTLEGGIYANPLLIGTNVGKELMKVLIHLCNAEEKIKKIYMLVKKDNIRALKLYLDFGFQIEDEQTDYYTTGKAL